MPATQLNIIVNRTREQGEWIAKVKNNEGVVTVVFRQRDKKFNLITHITDALRGYKDATKLSQKYLSAMNLSGAAQTNARKNVRTNDSSVAKIAATQDEIDKKFLTASEKLHRQEAIQSPHRFDIFRSATSEFAAIHVEIKDYIKKEALKTSFLNVLFSSVEKERQTSLSDNQKKHYLLQLMPVLDSVCGDYKKSERTPDDLREAGILLNYLATEGKLGENDQKIIRELLQNLCAEHSGLKFSFLPNKP